MSQKHFFLFSILIFNITFANAQVVWTEPEFPTQLDMVKVYFDASQGNAELAGFTGTVYAHTGVITNFSTSPTDWQHVQGNWGTADANVEMEAEGNNIFSISYTIEDYYQIGSGELVEKMAFVFRNEDGSLVGRNSDGSDIFTDVYPPDVGLVLSLQTPTATQVITQGESFTLQVQSNVEANFTVYDNSAEIYSVTSSFLNTSITADGALGLHTLEIVGVASGETQTIELEYFVLEENPPAQDPPLGTRPGLNQGSNDNYIFQLYAPGKSNAFLLCPANDFFFDTNYLMRKSVDGNTFWIDLPKSDFDEGDATYQYLVDGNIKIADPYSEVVLDPNHDQEVPGVAFEGLTDYPSAASGIVTVFDPEIDEFNWDHDNYEKPEKTNLVIYELLMRDFLGDHSYDSLRDTLDYLEKLHVNAIELMPISEFEANNSWGYNPSFHMAVDKYYGSRQQLKMFIDEAHSRGIAVILDVVFNHAFSQSPLCQLYWDQENFRPAADNPWLNVTPRHPFNVGYDFNHESPATKDWVKRVLEHWIEEYHFDGFRFDLSKGITQTNSAGNASLMAAYDASRIAILKEYADYIWSLDDDSYVIMEHFADNSEEKELAEYGMMLWENSNFQFAEAAMGYPSDLDWADYTVRGWDVPHAIGYMESHDEERTMYKVLTWGNSAGDYDTKNFGTALTRVEAAAAIFYSIPGPKMLWQFGELGYNYSINHCPNGTVDPNCRLDPKPIRWDWLEDNDRKVLNNVFSSFIYLKTNYPTFQTDDFTFDNSHDYIKTVHLNHSEMNAVVLANYDVVENQVNPDFPNTGMWFDYITGDTLNISDTQANLNFEPGEYRIYTSQKIELPVDGPISHTIDNPNNRELLVYPNPMIMGDRLFIDMAADTEITKIECFNSTGQRTIMQFENDRSIALDNLGAPGIYFLKVHTRDAVKMAKVMIVE